MRRLLRLVTRPNLGGPMRQAVALWHEGDAAGWRILLVVGRCGPGEASIAPQATGIPVLDEAGAHRRDAHGLYLLEDLRKTPDPWHDRRALRALRRLIAAFEPEVLHSHTTKAGWLGRRAAQSAGVPVIAHTFHGHVLRGYYPAPLALWLRARERRLARRTDLLFAVSPSCAQELAALGIAAQNKISILPPAVPTAAFAAATRAQARRELGLAEDAWVLGFAGRLVPIKRPDLFVATVAALPESQGLVFGDGRLRARLQGAKRLRFLGAREDLARHLAAVDLLVIPSEREGCPLVAIEAFAAGVPVLGFDVPGVRDLLGPWGAGVLVARCEGAGGLARAALALRADPVRGEQIVARARAGLSRFAPSHVAERLHEAYEQALCPREPAITASRPS